MESLIGKVAIVTGAGRGIGKAIAKAYAKEGAIVVCIARSSNEIREVSRNIQSEGGTAHWVTADVIDFDALERIMKETYELYGSIDQLIVNAGIDVSLENVEESSIEAWGTIMNVNLNGAYYTVRSVLPYMKKCDVGKIIIIGSELGHEGMAGKAAYCCSKAGLWMLTKVLAKELYESNICVNELIPGRVRTTIGYEKDEEVDYSGVDPFAWVKDCLLYTSDAADEVSPV